jgi:hypothetical protein
VITQVREQLRRAIRYRTLVPFVGAGVSIASAGLPAWSDLLEHGIAYGSQERPRPLIAAKEISILRRLARSGDVMTALSKLQKLLAQDAHDHWRNNTYAGWLEATFGAPLVADSSVLDALRRLEPRVIATTNYDLLLEEHVLPGGRSITWERPQDLRSLLRGGSGIAHLHGRYDRPQSVILSDSDYQRLIDDAAAIRVSQSLFEAGTLLFIGTSADGATDPHLSKLLENFAKLSDPYTGEDYPHVFLHPAAITPKDRSAFRSMGIETCSYGKTHQDLAPFLSSLNQRERITVTLDSVKATTRSIVASPSRHEGIQAAARAIERWVFPEDRVRVGYAERSDDKTRPGRDVFIERYVVPAESPCVFHYPISIAGWSVAEGRKISWPKDYRRLCDLERVKKLGRFEDVHDRLLAEVSNEDSPLREYLRLDALLEKFEDASAVIGDLYQDWSNTSQDVLFVQFLSVPVPRISSLTNTPAPNGIGVFNIDTLDEGADLNDQEALEKLELISDLVYSLYLRSGQDGQAN